MRKNKIYKPLPKYLFLQSSSIEGMGLFTNKDLKENKVLGIAHFDLQKVKLSKKEKKVIKNIPQGLLRSPLIGFVNHSTSSNCKLIKKGKFTLLVTTRKIKKGEELTTNYFNGKCGKNYIKKLISKK